MAKIKFLSLKCHNKQDSLNKDEVYLKVDGTDISSTFTMGDGDVVGLNQVPPFSFTGSVLVQLMERERVGADDILGTVNISDSFAGQGQRSASFSGNRLFTDWSYYLEYEVTS